MKKIQYLIIALLCAIAQGAWAQTEVSTKDALTNAISSGTTVRVKLTADIALSEKLTISSGKTVTIDLNGKTLSRSLSANENYGMVIYVNGGNLTIDDSSPSGGGGAGQITGGRSYNGAGILCEEGSTLTINGGIFKDNDASRTDGLYGRGGAIFMNPNTTLTITGGKFDNNSAYQGGAIYIDDGGPNNVTPASATISGAEFKNCWVTGDGGAIYNKGTATISDCTFSSNKATSVSGSAGGGLWNSSVSTLTLSNSTITGNDCEGNGGGINIHGNATISDCTICENTAGNDGGGIYVDASGKTVTFSGSNTITFNTAGSHGGGIDFYAAGTINMSGKPVIQYNTYNDLYLRNNDCITCTGAFTDGAMVGVTLENYVRTFTTGFSTQNGDAEPGNFFSTDNDKYSIVASNGEAFPGISYVECSWVGGNTDGHVETLTKYCSYSEYDGSTSLSTGWYLLSGIHTDDNDNYYPDRVTIDGDVKFVLEDGCDIEFRWGIYIKEGSTLTIYAQSDGPDRGKLYCVADGGDPDNGNAALGGNNEKVGGSLVIHGGYIYAYPLRNGAAGIGGGDGDSGMQSITIYGGQVYGKGRESGAGIGGGRSNNHVPTVTIYGGTVEADAGEYAAGIGGGEDRGNNVIKIYGGTIEATGNTNGAAIGGGEEGDQDSPIYIYGGTVTANGRVKSAAIGGGNGGNGGIVNIYGGTVNANGYDYSSGIGGGYEGNGGTLTIEGGTVTAICGLYGSAIGGGYCGSGGTLIINGGTVDASGGQYAAGIGGGQCGDGGTVTINGGSVTTKGGENGAGIGGGSSGHGGTVTINGGTVNTKGGECGAGIGGGAHGDGGTVTINGGNVTAAGDPKAGGGAGIGGGNYGNGGDVYIYGGYVKVSVENISSSNAIGKGHGGTDHGSLTLGAISVKKDGDSWVSNGERVSTVRNVGTYILQDCEHSGGTYTQKDDENHTISCTYCGGGDEAHTYGSGSNTYKCTKCTYEKPNPQTVTIYMANSDGTGYDDGTATSIQYGHNLPECTSVPTDMLFVGWKKTTTAPDGIVASDSELSSLHSTSETVTEDATYYARYQSTAWPGGGKGTVSDPYLISTTEHWNALANAISNKGVDFSGKYLQLTADITADKMVGSNSDGKHFAGTFDGDGHTLSINYSSDDDAAPFNSVKGATIKNLRVTGSVGTRKNYAGGLVAVNNGGNTTITNCRVSVHVLKSNNNYITGGFVGYISSGYVNIEGCIFDGKLGSSNPKYGNWGGFVGSTKSSTFVKFKHCLFKPESVNIDNSNNNCGTFCGGVIGFLATTNNCFYTQTCGTTMGTQAYTVSSGTSGLTLNYSGSTTNYGSITAYSNGLLFDGKLYTGSGKSITFTPKASNGKKPSLSASSGTLADNGDGTYKLTMTSANATVTATSYSNYAVTLYNGGSTDAANNGGKSNDETISENHNRIADVTITGRTLIKDGSWNTLCLPFDMTAAQVTEQLNPTALMELDVENKWSMVNDQWSIDNANGTYQTGFKADGTLYLYFKDASSIEAGKPYIIKWASGGEWENPAFTDVTINSHDPETVESADGKVSFVGNYDPVNLTANDKSSLFLGDGNTLYWPSEDMTINAFRAYFHVNLSGGAVRAFSLHFGSDSEANGIEEIENGRLKIENDSDAVYDLQGRRMSSSIFNLQSSMLKKGVYIYNGRKVVVP